eukprot:scaffold1988_cov48-Cyclotella_meneghiniana.AAC.4
MIIPDQLQGCNLINGFFQEPTAHGVDRSPFHLLDGHVSIGDFPNDRSERMTRFVDVVGGFAVVLYHDGADEDTSVYGVLETTLRQVGYLIDVRRNLPNNVRRIVRIYLQIQSSSMQMSLTPRD